MRRVVARKGSGGMDAPEVRCGARAWGGEARSVAAGRGEEFNRVPQ
jgi:hypothetical protein